MFESVPLIFAQNCIKHKAIKNKMIGILVVNSFLLNLIVSVRINLSS